MAPHCQGAFLWDDPKKALAQDHLSHLRSLESPFPRGDLSVPLMHRDPISDPFSDHPKGTHPLIIC